MLPVLLGLYYFGDPLPFPNPFDSDFGHGNNGVRDGKVFLDFNDAITKSAGIHPRFVIDEGVIDIGVYDVPHFVLTVANREQQIRGLTGTGPSFKVSDPKASAERFSYFMRAKGYNAEVVRGFLPKHPDDLFVVQVTDPRYPQSQWWDQPLLGWQPVFRSRTTSMGWPKMFSFQDFKKKSLELFPEPAPQP